ncbi:MAG: hypothetical protein DI539_04815 [Flavobacterium psychrophilum]|nr:MAG: hypothetical protein DI539_04815 [Flavobacterium psychrophilum]
MEQSFAYFLKLPLKTEGEVEQFMNDVGITYYEQYVEIIIDAKNTNLKKLKKSHPYYSRIEQAKKKGIVHYSIRL